MLSRRGLGAEIWADRAWEGVIEHRTMLCNRLGDSRFGRRAERGGFSGQAR